MIGFNSAAALVARGQATTIQAAMHKFVVGDQNVDQLSDYLKTSAKHLESALNELQALDAMTIIQRQVAAQQAFSADMSYFKVREAEVIKQRVRLIEMITIADATDFPMQLHKHAYSFRKQLFLHYTNLVAPEMPKRISGETWYKRRREMLLKAIENIDENSQHTVDRIDEMCLNQDMIIDWVKHTATRRENPKREVGVGTVLLNKSNPNIYCTVRRTTSQVMSVLTNLGLHLNVSRKDLSNFNIGTHYA